jgi:hypothetical protein
MVSGGVLRASVECEQQEKTTPEQDNFVHTNNFRGSDARRILLNTPHH